jgi:beta-lactamase superfamily II metal-dependent hydrolase
MTDRAYAATCYFVDVGRQRLGHSGSSNVILLPPPAGRRWPHAIVIDCGDRFSPTADLLRFHRVQYIEHFLVTHNDADHCDGLVPLVEEFHGRVGYVWFLQDRQPESISFLTELKRLYDEKALRSLEQLQTDLNQTPRVLYPDPPPSPADARPSLLLEVLYPAFLDNLENQERGDRNAASAVLRLSYGDARAILFPGDSQIDTLQRARAYFVRHLGLGPAAALSCEILAVPHHGGMLGKSRASAGLQRLYAEVVRHHYAVVSVATHNRDNHPFPEHIRALVQLPAGATGERKVLCTQITPQCFKPLSGRGLLPPVRGAPQAADATRANGFACAGTVVVDIGHEPLEPRRLAKHQDKVDELQRDGGDPLCRR